MATLATELRKMTEVIRKITQKTETPWDRGYNFAVEMMIEEINRVINSQSHASKYPSLGLDDIAATARELGFDVVKGHNRIMVSTPISSTEGDDIIEQSFPKVEETPMGHCESCGKDYPSEQVERTRMGEGEDDYASLCEACRGIPQLTPVGETHIKATDVF